MPGSDLKAKHIIGYLLPGMFAYTQLYVHNSIRIEVYFDTMY